MKINNKWPIICGGLLCFLMIASDYHGFTTEMAVVEFKGEVFEKKFFPNWGSFIVPLLIILIAFFAFQYWQPLNFNSYFLFLGIGIFASFAIYFQIVALSFAKASTIQPFHYTLIFWAIIL